MDIIKTNRSWTATINRLRRNIPDTLIKQREQGGAVLDYITWTTAADILDDAASLWKLEIVSKDIIGTQLSISVRISIWNYDIEDWIVRENVGFEEINKTKFGDTGSNAFDMAFRRAAVMFGVARELYKAPDYSPHKFPTKEHMNQLSKLIASGVISDAEVSGMQKIIKEGSMTDEMIIRAINYYSSIKEKAEKVNKSAVSEKKKKPVKRKTKAKTEPKPENSSKAETASDPSEEPDAVPDDILDAVADVPEAA